MAGLAGLIRKRHGKFLLTVKGRKLHEKHGPAGAYPALFETFARRFNWGYWDVHPPMRIVQEAILFSLRLLSRYGDTPRPEGFYADAFLRAFPPWRSSRAGRRYRSANPASQASRSSSSLLAAAPMSSNTRREACT